ncbi:hypothetical protein JOM56_004933 [Amanita muscaria]
MNRNQPTHNPQPPLPPGQPQLQQAQPDYPALWGVAQHPQQSLAHNPQWTISQLLQTPPPEQSALYANHYYDPQWQRQQLQYQQQQYHILPPVAQPPPPLAVQPGYNPYQPTVPRQDYVPHPVTSLQPQLPYYPHLQPQQQQQQQRLHNTPSQDLMPARRQRFEGPNLNKQAQYHAPPPPPPPLVQYTVVYPAQYQGLGRGDRSAGLGNAQRSANTGGPAGNRGGVSSYGRDARRGSMSGNRGEMAGRGSCVGSDGGGRRSGQSGGDAHTHGSGGKSSGATSMQAGGCNQSPNIVEPVTVPVATQFQGAQGVNISGNPRFTNVGMNTGNLTTTVNNYGVTHGLENLKEFVSFAALHNSAEQDPYRRCHRGTRENVLRQLRHWIDNPNPTDRIFWLYGPAGAGKSAIAQTIAHAYKQGEVAATFFFYRSDSGRNNGNRLFPTIAWQLAFSIPAVKDFIIHALDKTPHLPMTDVETQFEQLVAHPTNNIACQMPQLAPVIIIDGVDECSDEQLQRRFLTVIGNAVKDSCVPLRFLICSRPEALIEETLNQFKDFTLRIDLATLDDANRDIEKYLVDQFSDIVSKQGLDPSWPGQDIIEEIVFKSSGNFILASTLMRFIGDEDHNAVTQLDIVRKLKPHGTMAPFALLDELYLEILKRQLDQDFVKTFLALLVGRNSVDERYLHEDDAPLMNVSEKELHIKLRRMRSLLKFEPFIDVYHKSFLDFLQDSSRCGQYHVSKESGQKRYLELIVDSVVRHVSMAIEQPNFHETCRSYPSFKIVVEFYPPDIDLPVKDWQEALKPLLDLQDKLLNTSKPRPCYVTQIMRDLLLQLVVLQRNSHPIAAGAEVPMSTVTKTSALQVTEVRQNILENNLDRCLSLLLSCLPKTNSVFVIDAAIIDHMTSLLAFDYTEVAARVRSMSNAQRLIDVIGSIFLSQCGADAVRKAAYLASEIFRRVPLSPWFALNGPICFRPGYVLELVFQSVFISKILDHNYIVPVSWIYQKVDTMRFDCCNVNEQNESVHAWLKRTSPNFVTKIRVVSCKDHLKNRVHGFLSDARDSEDYPIHSFHGCRIAFPFFKNRIFRFGLESPCKSLVYGLICMVG